MSMKSLSAGCTPGISGRLRFAAFAAAALAIAAAGCGRSNAKEPAPAYVLTDAQRGVVAVATSTDDGSDHVTLCSGALVAPNLVLTARHCVSRALTATPSCDADGRSHNGVHLSADVDPSRISIYVGSVVRPETDAPVARAERTLHPKSQVLCDADVAFLVLDRPIDAKILPMRLHGHVEPGDHVVPVGFGGGPANIVGLKVARNDSTVLTIGPAANARTGAVLGPREFEVDQATCRGDSGGPAIDASTGEVVGVVSRGGSCSASGNHVYTRVDSYARLAAHAFVTAGRVAAQNLARRDIDEDKERER
jgi:hypothetical protein